MQASGVLGGTTTSNTHLENFFYQESLCLIILNKYEEAKKTLVKLIKQRTASYTIKGMYSVDPSKLLLNPYSQLAFVYQELGLDSEALRICEHAITQITDLDVFNLAAV